MKTLKLSQNQYAIVDDSDFDELSQFKWSAYRHGNTWYAHRSVSDDTGKKKSIRMHRYILGVSSGQEVDHINGNGLDNRRNNLRSCSRSENCRNSRIKKNNSSGFKGVSLFKATGKWEAYIWSNYKKTHLGFFDNPYDAAITYDNAAIIKHGDFAKLNFPSTQGG